MKTLRIIPVMLAALMIAGCSSSKRTAYDDTYYSPYNSHSSQVRGNGGTITPSTGTSSYDYQAYYTDSKNYVPNTEPVYQTTETVTDTNGVVYTTTETYYDADYAARIKRFGSGASSTLDYYDDYYTGGNTYVYIGDSWNWGFYPFGFSFYYSPYYGYYNPWYYDYYWYRPYYWYGPHWAWYDHYWYHPHHHHHHHHDYYGHGGHGHGYGHGYGHNDFSNYVASVHRNNTPGSMSYRTPQNHGGRGTTGAGVSRPTTSNARPTANARPSATTRPSDKRKTIGKWEADNWQQTYGKQSPHRWKYRTSQRRNKQYHSS